MLQLYRLFMRTYIFKQSNTVTHLGLTFTLNNHKSIQYKEKYETIDF